MNSLSVVTLFLGSALFGSAGVQVPDSNIESSKQFQNHVSPVLNRFCAHCHGSKKPKAGLAINQLSPDLVRGDDGEHWEEVLNKLNLGAMPPEGEPQLSENDRNALTSWITAELRRAAEFRRSTGGRNVLRRLTRYEYNNTLRDLLGVDLDFAKDLPPEGAAKEGFKNNSSVLVTSSLHLDYFQRIALSALEKALVPGDRPEPFELRLEAEDVLGSSRTRGKKQKRTKQKRGRSTINATKVEGGVVLSQSGSIQFKFDGVPVEGPIRIRIKAGSIPSKNWLPRMHVELGNDAGNSAQPTKTLASVDVDAAQQSPQWYEFNVRAEEFPLQTISATKQQFLRISNSFDPGTGEITPDNHPGLFLDTIEIVGPFYAVWPPKTRTRIFIPSELEENETKYSREVIERFMHRAYRRPASEEEVSRMHQLFLTIRARDASFEDAIIGTLSAVLSAPSFLLIVEPSPTEDASPQSRHLNGYEIASRLSYFLWSSMPDEILFDLAAQEKLHDPDVLRTQVVRMLADSRSQQFVEHFSSQWLDLDSIYRVAVNPEFFPNFHEEFKNVMREQTVRFFGIVLKEDLSALSVIDSDFDVLNGQLARHYGISGVTGTSFQKVSLTPDQNRGGILTHASILTGNSSGDDTHPVKRGVWLLERLLGDPPPPPPPAVPTLAEDSNKGQRLSLKQKLFAHRQETACMNCHRKIDPWGIAFENYDGVGSWRESNFAASLRIRQNRTKAKGSQPTGVDQARPTISSGKSTVASSGKKSIWPRKAVAAATVAVDNNDSDEVKELKATVNESLEALRRPHNHLRRLGPDGPADQHRRFLGYIKIRMPLFDDAVNALIHVTGEDKAIFMKGFTSANQEILKSNNIVRTLAEKASPTLSTPKASRKASRKPRGARQRALQRRASRNIVVDVDPRTKLSDGTVIRDLRDLKTYLLEHKKDQIAKTLVRKTLSYSLGRYLDFADTESVQELTDGFQRNGYRMQALIEDIVLSKQFMTK